MNIQEYVASNQEKHLAELSEFLRIPSISTEPEHKEDVQNAAKWLAGKFNALNASGVTIHQTPGHPVVTAEFGNDPAKPTVLVYGHYDVQPTGDDKLWESLPFEPTIRDGKIFGRGTTDDKGQVFTHLKAIEYLQQQGDLPCNIRFMIEGEEEISSVNLPAFIEQHPELLKCDAAVVSDTAIIDEETPAITTGLRGLVSVAVTVKGPGKELHSGVFGGAIGNPIEALTKMIASVTDENGLITIPNFYDDVKEYSPDERAEINQRANVDENLLEETKSPAAVGEKGYSTLERIGTRPAFTPISFHAGPEIDKVKNVISPAANAILQIRIVPNQDPKKIAEMLIEHLKAHTPEGVIVETEIKSTANGWALQSFNGAAHKAASKAYEKVWGKKPVPDFCGGSIPVVATFQKAGISTTMMGFGLESDNMHSPNEFISINRFNKGIETMVHFYQEFPKEHQAQLDMT